jgi:hypothetical protein
MLSLQVSKGEIIHLSGVYEGINLYVENDVLQGGSCMNDIFVNDVRINFEKDKQFFEIDMSFLKLNQHVTVKIICEAGCKAKIINPEAINIMYGFQFMTLTLEMNRIEWITTNEKPGGKYIIEMLVHKQWVSIGEIPGKPSKLVTTYERKIETLKQYSYRVKYIDKDGIPHSSKPIKYHKSH